MADHEICNVVLTNKQGKVVSVGSAICTSDKPWHQDDTLNRAEEAAWLTYFRNNTTPEILLAMQTSDLIWNSLTMELHNLGFKREVHWSKID